MHSQVPAPPGPRRTPLPPPCTPPPHLPAALLAPGSRPLHNPTGRELFSSFFLKEVETGPVRARNSSTGARRAPLAQVSISHRHGAENQHAQLHAQRGIKRHMRSQGGQSALLLQPPQGIAAVCSCRCSRSAASSLAWVVHTHTLFPTTPPALAPTLERGAGFGQRGAHAPDLLRRLGGQKLLANLLQLLVCKGSTEVAVRERAEGSGAFLCWRGWPVCAAPQVSSTAPGQSTPQPGNSTASALQLKPAQGHSQHRGVYHTAHRRYRRSALSHSLRLHHRLEHHCQLRLKLPRPGVCY